MSEEKKDEVLEQEKELDADELDAVAGGGACYCPVVGGGTANASEDAKACGCVIGGGGDWTFEKGRCVCVAYGQGTDEYIG